MALGAAALLIGGGGFLAINAGSSDGGADSPEAAFQGALDALSAEDLIGAAEYVEPIERETMIKAGFDVIDELVRLEVFSPELELSSVAGFDLDFSGVEFEVTEIRPGLASIALTGGETVVSIDGTAVPLGRLITDRIDADDLDVRETEVTQVERDDTRIVAVERDGRWYLSFWYSVAENARLTLGEPLPDLADRPAAIGGDTPERAIELMITAATEFDLVTAIGMLDPQEAAALYDYAPLFLDDAQEAADDVRTELRRAGWTWDITDLQLSSESSGGLATVFIDALAFEACGPEGSLNVAYSNDLTEISFEAGGVSMEMTIDGDCLSMSVEDGTSPQIEEFCSSELADEAGLEALTGGAFAELQSLSTPGIVVRKVDGRWYVSPLRTGSQMLIDTLRGVEPESLAETVDALTDFFRDPFAVGGPFGDLFGQGFSSDFDSGFGEDFTFDEVDLAPGVVEEYEVLGFTEQNAYLIAPELDVVFMYDLIGGSRDDAWLFWLTTPAQVPFGDGVLAEVYLNDGAYADVVIMTDLAFESDEALAEWVGGVIATDGALTYVRAQTDWDSEFIVARSGSGIVLVGLYDAWNDLALDLLRTQLAFGG